MSPDIQSERILGDIESLPAGSRQELHQYKEQIERINDELQRRQEQLKAEQTRYFDFYNAVPIGCLTVNEKGMIVQANLHAACMLNVPNDTLINLSIPRFIHEDDIDTYNQYHQQLFSSGKPQAFELQMVKAGKTVAWVQVHASLSCGAQRERVCHVFFSDISGRKKVEEERELMARLLTQINATGDLRTCISELTASLQSWSDCEAVGIRLRDGEDYPYYETRGFPLSFVEAESVLCLYGPDGALQRDFTGNPVLDCMCGNVLSGRFDASQPFFTARGSFWSNNTSALLAKSTESDRQACTRNRCNSEGYESVALIPMHSDNRVLGLLQFNDRCPGRFTLELIQHFERIADTLALAISRRQAEDQLRKSEEKYRTVAEFTYAMETWQAPDGTYKYVSPSCKRVTGYTVEAFLQDPELMEHIVYPEDREKLLEHLSISHPQNAHDNKGLDFRILTPDDEVRWLSHSCTPVYDTHGQWAGRRGSFREITRSKRSEEDRLKQTEKKRQIQKTTSLQRMGGAIAHHFNNKLQVVMGYLELAIEHLPEQDVARYNLTSALDAAVRAAEVSRLMLTYLGQVNSKREPHDLTLICREFLPTLKNRLHRGLKLETDLQGPGPVISTSSEEIRQILLNTMANACEATTDEHDCIGLRVTTSFATGIGSHHRFPRDWQPTDTSYACLEVRDNGCGLSESEFEEIFDPFYSTKFAGRGLGLPVVKGIVKAHGGVVTVESSPGLGSTFRCYFPLSQKCLPSHPEAVPSIPERRQEGTVLVIEDDKVVLEITSTLLSNLGYTILTATDGIEAIEIFQQHKNKIQFVISDFAMPRLNGLEALQKLREISPDIKVILVSGYSEDHVMSGNFRERPQFFLKKPYSSQALKEAIAFALEESA
ncbi:PAS domain S-box protein [Desulfopila aestuarii]|uniref:histidine kinase n=1 Tax=Desulfopila aestuarii DSM 18488 TaxID=1121416 RepID=A0A1M7YKS7_9BACT|nr:PAS domain S-box protein [Desulfopila aestuarii]SHO53194.1 PAS domain S-box-containing protein [Desulfopila aestuarii DSM 18488]